MKLLLSVNPDQDVVLSPEQDAVLPWCGQVNREINRPDEGVETRGSVTKSSEEPVEVQDDVKTEIYTRCNSIEHKKKCKQS